MIAVFGLLDWDNPPAGRGCLGGSAIGFEIFRDRNPPESSFTMQVEGRLARYGVACMTCFPLNSQITTTALRMAKANGP